MGNLARMGNRGHAYRVLVARPERRRPLGRRRRRWEDNIKNESSRNGAGAWIGLILYGARVGGGCCECGN